MLRGAGMNRRERGLVLVGALLCGLSSGGAQAAEASPDIGAWRGFALARFDEQPAYVTPVAGPIGTRFLMALLDPMLVREAACVDAAGNQKPPVDRGGGAVEAWDCSRVPGAELWLRVEKRPELTAWVPAGRVFHWESRHALRPTGDATIDKVPAYCDVKDVEQASRGHSQPCMTFSRRILFTRPDMAAFPVLEARDFGDGIKFDRRRYLRIVVPVWASAPTVAACDASVRTNSSGTFGLFCPVPGGASSLSPTPVDLAPGTGGSRSPLAARDVWVPVTGAMEGVAVLFTREARFLARLLERFSEVAGRGPGCRDLDVDSWRTAFGSVAARGAAMPTSGDDKLLDPPMGRVLREVWRLSSDASSFLMGHSSAHYTQGDAEACKRLADRVVRAARLITRLADMNPRRDLVVVPFSLIP